MKQSLPLVANRTRRYSHSFSICLHCYFTAHEEQHQGFAQEVPDSSACIPPISVVLECLSEISGVPHRKFDRHSVEFLRWQVAEVWPWVNIDRHSTLSLSRHCRTRGLPYSEMAVENRYLLRMQISHPFQ